MVDDRPVVDTTTMGMDVYFSLKKLVVYLHTTQTE